MKKSLTLAVLAAAVGCGGGPSALEAPSVSPSGAAAEAMTMYDKDGDGFIAAAELDAAPGVKAAMGTIDADKDGKASEDEIAARISAWSNSGTALMTCSPNITLDGRPLAGATVTFEPEPFLGDAFKAAVGQTNDYGDVTVSVPKENRVPADAPPGVAVGFYQVKISKQANGAETLPEKFNSKTTLGQEVAPDDPAIKSRKVRYELK